MSLVQVGYFQRHPVGEQQFTTTGTSSFIVPNDVYSISAVVIGGGGGAVYSSGGASGGGGGDLRYINNLDVTPGETLTITVGTGGTKSATTATAGGFSRIARGVTTLLEAAGGGGGNGTSGSGTKNGTSSTISGNIGGGNGGLSEATGNNCSGGGGAGGYSGTGGTGSNNAAGTSGTGGAAGGGGGAGSNGTGGAGGGVGFDGEGDNGTGGGIGLNGGGGSGGTAGTGGVGAAGAGGLYGGGGGGSDTNTAANASNGGQGAVRIVWGPNRFFPTTNVDRKVEFLTSTTSTTNTITIPATAEEGDIAILFDGGAGGTTATAGAGGPTGWTTILNQLVNDAGGNSMRCICSYKILSLGEAGTSITGMDAPADGKIMLVFRPNFTIANVTAVTIGNVVSLADAVLQTITLTSATLPAIGCAHMRAGTGGGNGTVTTRSVTNLTEVSNGTFQYAYYAVENSVNTVVDATADFADSGTNGLQTFYLNLDGAYS